MLNITICKVVEIVTQVVSINWYEKNADTTLSLISLALHLLSDCWLNHSDPNYLTVYLHVQREYGTILPWKLSKITNYSCYSVKQPDECWLSVYTHLAGVVRLPYVKSEELVVDEEYVTVKLSPSLISSSSILISSCCGISVYSI